MPVLPLWAALILAAASGVILDAAFPDLDVWPLAFVGIGLTLIALRGRRFWSGALVGLLSGATLYFPQIDWIRNFLGPDLASTVGWVPLGALAGLMSIWCALGGGLIAVAYRRIEIAWPRRWARLLLLPAVISGLWISREAISAVWPYGGFSWARVGMSQSESPLAQLFPWLGLSGVGFCMVVLVAVTLEATREIRIGGLQRAAAIVGIAAVLVAVPAVPTTQLASLRVGAVQGDTKAGYFDPPENRGDNLLKQMAETEPVYDENVDVVLWPEGSSDVDPMTEAAGAQLFNEVTERAGAPLVAGIITGRGDEFFNEVVLWKDGAAADYYDKKHPVPFGEYVPDRAVWRQFAPDLIDLIGREYTPGTTDGVLDLGTAIAGVAICFDIVDDGLITDMVDEGAQIIFAPTNNADFGRTDESVQQLAIARIRALETGRAVVNVSTVGTSAVLLPDGTTTHRLPVYEPGVIVADVPTYTGSTPAVALGRQLEWLVMGIGLLGLLVALITTRGQAPVRASGQTKRAPDLPEPVLFV